MNTTDQENVLRAMEDARRVLGEYIAPAHATLRVQYNGSSRSSIEMRLSTLSIE